MEMYSYDDEDMIMHKKDDQFVPLEENSAMLLMAEIPLSSLAVP